MTVKINDEIDDTEKCGHTRVQWLVVTVVSMIMLTYGLETGWMSPMTKILASDLSPTGYPLSKNELSWVSSVTALTAVFSVFLYAYLADVYGRKLSVLTIGILQTIAWAIRLCAANTSLLIISRIVSGISAGGCFSAVPIYVREISDDRARGAMLSFVISIPNIGLLFMYIMGGYMEYYTMLWISLCVTAIAVSFMFFAPESPAFLVKKEQFDKAAKTFAILRGLEVDDKIIQLEMTTARNEEDYYKSLPNITFTSILKNKAWRRGLIYLSLINTAQSGSGTFVIVTYVWIILSSTGVSLDPDLQSLVVPILQTIGSLISIILVQKFGRKILIVSGSALLALGTGCMGTILLLHYNGINSPFWLPILAIATCVWANSAGLVPAYYATMTETFNFQVRSKLMGVLVSYAWFICSMQTVIFIPISEMLGMHTMFYFFAGINVFGVIAALLLIPETKGKTVEEIERILRK